MKKILLLILCLCLPSFSALKTWKAAGPTTWANGPWSPTGAPAATDTAWLCGDSANFNDTILAAAACTRLKISDGFTAGLFVGSTTTMTVPGSGKFIDITGSPVFAASALLRCNITGNNQDDTITGFTHSFIGTFNNPSVEIRNTASALGENRLQVIGSILTGALRFGVTGTQNIKLFTNNNSIKTTGANTAVDFSTYSTSTGTLFASFGSSVMDCDNNVGATATTNGEVFDSMGSSMWNVAKNLTYYALKTSIVGTSKCTADSGLAAIFTSANKKIFHIFEIAKTSAAKLTYVDTLKTDSLVLTSGRDSLQVVQTVDMVHNGLDTMIRMDNIHVSRDYTQTARANKNKLLGGALYFDGSTDGTFQSDTNTISFILKKDAGKIASAAANIKARKIIDSSGVLSGGSFNIDVDSISVVAGQKIAIGALKHFRINTYTIGDIAGTNDSIVSGTPGTKCTLKIAGAPTIPDIYMSADVVYSDTFGVPPVPQPTITDIQPGIVPAEGGVWDTIRGTNFGVDATVKYGDSVIAIYGTRNDTLIEWVTVAQGQGWWPVLVTNDNLDTVSTLIYADSSIHLPICPPIVSYPPYTAPRLTAVNITPSVTGIADSFHAETPLPTGLTIAKLTGAITGTPTVLNQMITVFPIKWFACSDSGVTNASITINENCDTIPNIHSALPTYVKLNGGR